VPWQVAHERDRWVEWWPDDGGMVWQLPHTIGAGVCVGVADPNAAAMASICADVRAESDIIPLIVLMPVCIWEAVAPLWPLVASDPWHPAQYCV
jgi:hypothetical protein